MNLNKVFPSNYLKSSDLEKDTIFTIDDVSIEILGQGVEAEKKLVAKFRETEKKMVLNKTNSCTISGMYGDDTDDWIGNKIIIGSRDVEYQGKRMMGLRVVPKKPQAQSTSNDPVPF